MARATVACVLRSGGVYDARWVRALYRGVRENWPEGALDFVCLADVDVDVPGVCVEPLAHGWPGGSRDLTLSSPANQVSFVGRSLR